MKATLKSNERKSLLAKLSHLWRRVITLLRDPRVQKNGLNAFKLALKTTGDVAEACGFGPLKVPVGIVLENIERFELSDDVQDDLIAIAKKLEKMVELFERYRDNGHAGRLSDFMDSLTSAVDAVQATIHTKLARSRLRRVWEAPDDAADVIRMIRVLGDQAESFVARVAVEIDAQVIQVGMQVEEVGTQVGHVGTQVGHVDTQVKQVGTQVGQVGTQVEHVDTQVKQVLEDLNLFELAFIEKALYQAVESKGCTPGTRADFIDSLFNWSTASANAVPPVCWVYGHAGVGKTTIMYTISNNLHRGGLLGGSFFCSRSVSERRSITNIFPTIARSLAHALPGFGAQLVTALRNNTGVNSFAPDMQFDILISSPARAARDALAKSSSPWQPKIVVIDALDECENPQGTISQFLQILGSKAQDLGLRFLIASRPERGFAEASAQGTNWSRAFYMQDIPAELARQDVRAFLTAEWSQSVHYDPQRDWPTQERIEHLALLSDGLFIYASTAWKFVSDTDAVSPADRLEEILALGSVPSEENIDKMYDLILSGLWKRRSIPSDQELTRRCVQAIICLHEPLCIQDLALLLDIKASHVTATLHSLQSVIRVPRSDASQPISTFHASFADYLLNSQRSGSQPWHIDVTTAHRELCLRSWEVMKQHLHFNVSGSSSSYLSNDQQPELKQPSGALAYACLRWFHHFSQLRPSYAELKELQTLLATRFLFWLEVLSTAKRVQEGQGILAALSQCMRALKSRPYGGQRSDDRQNDNELLTTGTDPAKVDMTGFKETAASIERLAHEAKEFIIAFSTPISTSAPHIYMSALASTHVDCMVKSVLNEKFRRLPTVVTEQARQVLPTLRLRGHKLSVWSVAFSPDGKRVASGSLDNTVRMWDVDTGEQIGEPFCGHTDSVWSVAFSPDGKRVASGSSDHTIRMWEIDTGSQIGEPLYGHTDLIWSVAFSHDGKHLASGSSDDTTRIWHVDTGAQICEPLRGHTDTVFSVAFSPDGKRVASGSHDYTIRMWDVNAGTQIGEPLRGHTRPVLSVAFSPDGKHLASGSHDHKVRMWDINLGAQIGEPFHGHTGPVSSVVFSPDGQRVSSGSLDDTIRMWDVGTGVQISAPLCGHTDSVRSVTFSPDGKYVASGSSDVTIQMWEVDTGTQTGEPLRGHAAPVRSVAFSPDGKHLASGSWDHTIRIWADDTGAQIGEPLRGHIHSVLSVAFSPDGKYLSSGSSDQTVRMWDVDSGAQIGEPLRGHTNSVVSVAFSPDGQRLASGSHDHSMRIWDVGTNTQIGEPLCGHTGSVISVAFSPDGKRLASGSSDETILMWNTDTWTQVGEPLCGHDSCVNSVAFSPNGELVVSSCWDRTVRIWDPDGNTQVGEPLRGHTLSVTSVAFSTDGQRIVSASDDRTIRIWAVDTGAEIGEPLLGHTEVVHSVTCSPDGKRVASGSRDNTIRIWDINVDYKSNEASDRVASSSCHPPHIDNHVDMKSAALNQPSFSPSTAFPDLGTPFGLSPTYHFGLDQSRSFTPHQDGWLRGPNKELIFWVLPEYRRGLWTPSTVRMLGAHPVKLDLSDSPLGTDWIKCDQDYDVHAPDRRSK